MSNLTFSEENPQYQEAATKYEAIIINYPGGDYALKALKNLAVTYIRMQKLTEAQDGIEKLQTDFAGEPDLLRREVINI